MIIGLSGKAASGKSSAASFYTGLKMVEVGLIRDFKIFPDGNLYYPTDIDTYTLIDMYPSNSDARETLRTKIWPHVKQYSFADPLKQKIAIDILGMTWYQCYDPKGKAERSKIPWKNLSLDFRKMLGLYKDRQPPKTDKDLKKLKEYETWKKNADYYDEEIQKNVPNRKLLQLCGRIIRDIDPDAWARTCINEVKKDGCPLAIITDVRFKNECEYIHKAGGKIIRLTRCVNPDDNDPSETELDNYKDFDEVIDNSDGNLASLWESLYNIGRIRKFIGKIS